MPLYVMPGLVPGISIGAIAAAEMDARNKSGHDGGGRNRAREAGNPPPARSGNRTESEGGTHAGTGI